MLYEVKKVKQNPGEPFRRWFVDSYFDLIVWFDSKKSIIGFQLCYDKYNNQHAFTWAKEKGFMHHRVDDGENKPGKYKATPILILDGFFDQDSVARKFKLSSSDLEAPIADLIYAKIIEYTV